LHLVVNNASFAGIRGLTTDGFNMVFGGDHMSHFLCKQLRLPQPKALCQATAEHASVLLFVASRRDEHRKLARCPADNRGGIPVNNADVCSSLQIDTYQRAAKA
jgi:NAD(P)-dependent dehydrogenase (short-subunit alcohol dehydrogenase family)